MKNPLLFAISITLALFSCKTQKNDDVPRIPEVEKLISSMSIEEKVGQTIQITLDVVINKKSKHRIELDTLKLNQALLKYHVGSILNTTQGRALPVETWNRLIKQIQNVAIDESRLHVPILYGVDAIHGASYTKGAILFPQQIAQAATWNPVLAQRINEVTAQQTRASGIPWTFSPVMDLGSDPRWARMWETYGEDPYLASKMGESAVIGYQGVSRDNVDQHHVAACLKHFFCYASNSGKDRTPIEISKSTLYDYYLPSFKAAIEKGALSVMVNSGIVNSLPVHANRDLLTNLLKQRMEFDGVVVTDWADIEKIHTRDKVAVNHKEAVKMAFNAGIDLSMVPFDYVRYCKLLTELVKSKEVSMERLDDAVRRNLVLKHRLNLFNTPTTSFREYPNIASESSKKLAYNTASEAITLLKNEGNILPISTESKLLILGPNANTMRPLLGGWSYSWQGQNADKEGADYSTFLEAAVQIFGRNNVEYLPTVLYRGAKYFHEESSNLSLVSKSAMKADYIILCLGENSYTEKPGDLSELDLSEKQQTLVDTASKSGKPLILVLSEGRPRIIRNIEPKVSAIVQTYISGSYTAEALMDVITGKVNPSGKLPYTYPMHANSLDVYYHKPSEESKTTDGLYDYSGGFYPQYPFGYGLSYTTFEYRNLKVSPKSFSSKDTITVSVEVKNIGSRKGKEVVQLYSSDCYASLTPDVIRLRRFRKVQLNVGETSEISFVLTAKDLSFVLNNGQRIAEKGQFVFQIDALNEKVELTEDILYEKF
ncbi:glycoside hydrolase family 3 C-terminal domain-containing protein [Halosquirtibacter xylanolyticus]|uniref:glycoside hydrolase family 3 N-terminal domain-containing protein n=1 Tax=Halosquirtibacter xylanolyticus TaxID=3374599 RepID=UPI003747D65B|nr:glycoside hydrolase family 3 C-terminal domain-containing protein [Prolixibacteraceae bacterium]